MDPEKLAVLIRAHNMSLGTTPNGVAWTMKALHPAANTEPIAGIPDRTGVPVAFVEFKSNYTVGAPGSGLWNAMVYTFPSPVLFGCVQLYGPDNNPLTPAGGGWAEFVNRQLTGANIGERAGFWTTQVGTARLAYQSLTVNFDCADLTNNGVVTACQLMPAWLSTNLTTVGAPPMPSTIYSGPVIDNSNAINFPLAVQYRAKAGAYMPIKLTNPALPFLNQGERAFYSQWWPYGGGPPQSTLWPGYYGYALPRMLDGQMGAISFLNIAPTTSLRLTFRMGVEVIPLPGSAYSSFMHPSPPVDHAALDAYYMISAKLFDAYPDEYNDFGKLWEVIKGIAAPIGQVIKNVPGIGQSLYAVGNLVGKAVDNAYGKPGKSRETVTTGPQAETASTVVTRTPAQPKKAKKKVAAGSAAVALPQRVKAVRAKKKVTA